MGRIMDLNTEVLLGEASKIFHSSWSIGHWGFDLTNLDAGLVVAVMIRDALNWLCRDAVLIGTGA
jgi:hypothetical protein